MLIFAVVVASFFTVDGARHRLRTSQSVTRPHQATLVQQPGSQGVSRPHQATLVQQPAMVKAEIVTGPVEIHGLAGNLGSYPDEVTSVDTEASPPSAQDSSHEDEDEGDKPLVSVTDESGLKPPAAGATQVTDFSGSKDYDNDNATDADDASDYWQGSPSNRSEVLTMQDEQELGVTPAPPEDDPNAQTIDLPFVMYPGYAKLEKEKLEKRKLAHQKKEQQKLEQQKLQQEKNATEKQPMQPLQGKQPQQIQRAPPQLVKSLTATGSSHTVKVTAGVIAAHERQQDSRWVGQAAAHVDLTKQPLGKPVHQPGWGQPVGILRPKGWEMCLKFAKYAMDEGYKGVALVRVWKSTCEPSMLAGSATERYRMMCISLGRAVEKYAVMPTYRVEDICDSVLATFHDISAVDTPFDR